MDVWQPFFKSKTASHQREEEGNECVTSACLAISSVRTKPNAQGWIEERAEDSKKGKQGRWAFGAHMEGLLL